MTRVGGNESREPIAQGLTALSTQMVDIHHDNHSCVPPPLLESHGLEWFYMALKLGCMMESRGSFLKISLPEFSTRDPDVTDPGCGLDSRTVK